MYLVPVPDRSERCPLGAALSPDDLAGQPYEVLARLRETEPVSWVPALGTWLVTSRDLAVQVMRDADRFTVDDPRFSTAAVLGASMLSLDGAEHERHRSAFAKHFRPTMVRDEYERFVTESASRLVACISKNGSAELRTAVAAPLAVESISAFLGLHGLDPNVVLGWYRVLSDAIVGLAVGQEVPDGSNVALAELNTQLAHAVATDSSSLLRDLHGTGILHPEEITGAVAVVMFGAIETSEGMTANALWHLLSHPDDLAAVREDRSLLSAVVEESLRLEPAAAVIDRFTTCEAALGDVVIPERDMVSVSLLAANRDPSTFVDPDTFDIRRHNMAKHVSFVHGPHGCIGVHLARLETHAALNAVLDQLPNIELDASATQPPDGLIFRKPEAVVATWG